MKQKFQQLMDELDLTAGKMAEMLEIQPAVISHLKAGRNKPSFDLIQKILIRFPQINPDWLLLDSGQMFRDGYEMVTTGNLPKHDLFTEPESEQEPNAMKIETPRESNISELLAGRPEISHSDASSKIERVIVFYSDGTFDDFHKR